MTGGRFKGQRGGEEGDKKGGGGRDREERETEGGMG